MKYLRNEDKDRMKGRRRGGGRMEGKGKRREGKGIIGMVQWPISELYFVSR